MALKQSTHGFDPLAYMGIPYNPVISYFQERDPVATDNSGIPLGTIWLNTINKNAFMLVAKLYNPAIKKTEGTWVEFIGNNGSVTEVHTEAGDALPVAGVLNILGGPNINTNAVGSTVFVNLDETIALPNTNVTETAGEIRLGGNRWISNYGASNTFVGEDSGRVDITMTGINNTGIGNTSLSNLISGQSNTCVGSGCGVNLSDGNNNSALGTLSLFNATVAVGNVSIGYQSLWNLVDGDFNIAIGSDAASEYDGAQSSNICIGNIGTPIDNNVIRIGTDGTNPRQQDRCFIAGDVYPTRNLVMPESNIVSTEGWIIINTFPATTRLLGTPGVHNLFLGADAGSVTIVGAQSNVAIGDNTLGAIIGGIGNTVVGMFAGAFVENAVHNTLVGQNAGNSIVDNIENVCVGYESGNSLAAGDLNVFIGSYAGASLTGNAGTVGNTALGHGALRNCTGGSANLCLGGLSGQNLTTNESNNVLIQNNGVLGRSREIRIGTTFTGGGGDGQQSKCWIAAIRGVTTDVVDAIPVLIDSTGQLGTVSSSERYKDDIEDMGPESDMIMALRPVTFTYKKDPTKRMQYGLIAEEVADLFPKLVIYDEDGLPDTIRYHDLPVLLLNELQKCVTIIENLKERIEVLEKKKAVH